jgi:hypothetical protein
MDLMVPLAMAHFLSITNSNMSEDMSFTVSRFISRKSQ